LAARVEARDWLKIVISAYPSCIRRPLLKSSRRNIATAFGMKNQKWCGYLTVQNFEDMFIRFDRMYERDRRTDRQADTV